MCSSSGHIQRRLRLPGTGESLYMQTISHIARSDYLLRESFPSEHAESLKNVMVQLTAHAIAIGRSKFILRKLFVAVRTSSVGLAHSQCYAPASSLRSHSGLSLVNRRSGQIGSWPA